MIGDKIKALRKSKKITQEQLAKILNITPQAVSKWERGLSLPDIELLVPIADYFGVSIDYLLRE
ncbi:MAG: helix-turn-helix domain-containing protein [Acutalibacteraceae bacterium]